MLLSARRHAAKPTEMKIVSVSQICVAYAAIATVIHCERSCVREIVSQRHASVGKDTI